MSCDDVAINKKHKIHIYNIYVYNIYIYIYNIYVYSIYIYIYISNWITIIYSCTVNVNLMLIYIELSELIIYCEYA